jgi:tetratricopeptide (TPR) repeat protein
MPRTVSDGSVGLNITATAGPQHEVTRTYHVFMASPGDVDDERRAVRAFFKSYNQNYAQPRGLRFEVVDWENYSSAGVGRPQELITEQTLKRYQGSLALVIATMAQRFGSNSGTHESGSEEEFEWAVKSRTDRGFPEVKCFFRRIEKLSVDPKDPKEGLAQWDKVQAFRKRVTDDKTIYSRSYKDTPAFSELLENDVARWLNSPDRPWFVPDQPPSRNSLEWPEHIVQELCIHLNNEFTAHMRAGEDLSADQARARYIHGVLKLRAHDGAPGKEGPLEDFLKPDGLQLLIVGAGGSGKTTMLMHAAAIGAHRAAQDVRAPIVIYLRLPSFDRSDGGFDLLLERLSVAARVDRTTFEALWRDGRRPITFLLDSLNEVAQAYQASCIQALRTALQNSPPLHRYIITSRPGGEFEAVAGRSTDDRRVQAADILKFGPQETQSYLKAQGLVDLQSRISGRLEELASNPFLLWAITRTLASSPQGTLKNRGSLFGALIDDYIFKEREQSKPKPRPTDYNYEFVKKPVLAQLALEMTENGVTEVIDNRSLWKQIKKHLAVLEDEHRGELPLEAETFMPPDKSAVSFLREAVNNGVLMRDGDRLRFMHESVQEYFAAVAIGAVSDEIENVVRRAPVLKLARLDARGPMFETLVTWAGLCKSEKVTELIEHIQDAHPLLAAHLAVEAGLSGGELQGLRNRFVSLTCSEHEQRRRLGAMGLAMIPSDEPEVVARLIEILDDFQLSGIAEQGLKATPSKDALSALVKASIANSEALENQKAKARLLRNLAREHTARMTEVVLDAWSAPDSDRGRVAALAALLNAKESWEEGRRPILEETLLMMSMQAELTGDVRRSAEIDALRRCVEEAPVPKFGLKNISKSIAESIKKIQESEAFANACADKDDAVLEALLRDGEPFQRNAALSVLAKRNRDSAVAPVVESTLEHPGVNEVKLLEALSRSAVQRYLAGRISNLEGMRLRRAQLLAGLLADSPARDVVKTIFEDCGEGLRALAARVAPRADAEDVALLIGQLGNETSMPVLESCVRALGESRNPAALNCLLDLMFGPDMHGPANRGSNFETDEWTKLIHDALADAGAADITLERTELQLRSRRSFDAYFAVCEACRWFPLPRALALVERAMGHDDPQVRQRAQWALACEGNAEAWQALLHTEMDSLPPIFESLGRDAAQRLETAAADPAARIRLIAVSESVLRPALADSAGKRITKALELSRRLPRSWVGAAWQDEALAVAEHLLQSGEPDQKVQAVRAIRHFAEANDDRILTILLNDADEAVIKCAYEVLGAGTASQLTERLQSALRAGDGAAARHIAAVLGILFEYSTKERNAIRDSTGRWLDAGDHNQCVAALIALAMLYPGYDDTEEWLEIGKRARDALQRCGLEETWRLFAKHAPSLGERHRGFVHIILDGFAEDSERLAFLVSMAEEFWPNDLEILGTAVRTYIARGRRDEAGRRIAVIQEQFHEQVSQMWLGNQFAKLDRPQDALRHYRAAAEKSPTDDVAHFLAGWYAFLTGDLDGSVESTRQSLKLYPTRPGAEFNLGIALLVRGDRANAELAYRRGIALARRDTPANARLFLEEALGDFARLPPLPDTAKGPIDHIRALLGAERDRFVSK